MKRLLAALLALCVLMLAGCGDRTPASSDPAAKPSAAAEDADVVLYEFRSFEVSVPRSYLDLLVVETGQEPWNEHWTPLISFFHKASVEAFSEEHPYESAEGQGVGWLGGVTRLDRIGFEDWLTGEKSGSTLFGSDGEGSWYIILRPTDVRVYRPDESWDVLNEWMDALPDQLVARNALTPYDANALFDADYTYDSEHVELGCRFPGEPMDLVILSLSQPETQGTGGIWCVERVHYVYTDYSFTDTQLVFPVAFGVDEAAADYYARLQAECSAGEHPELLTPTGAALDYARRVTWIFGEDVSATDFERIELVG